jgi:hypothetical protein
MQQVQTKVWLNGSLLMKTLWDSVVALALSAIVCVAITSCSRRYREEYRHTLWDAASTSKGAANDIWIEYDSINRNVIAIYRDCDGDGYVDECMTFCGPIVALYRGRNHDGLMDTVRNILDPRDFDKRIQAGTPESGPFTRERLDELARAFPRVVGQRQIPK